MPPHHWLFGHIALSPYIVKQLPPLANGAYIGDLIRRRYPNLGDAFIWTLGHSQASSW